MSKSDLSPRQLEAIKLVSSGLSNQQVADKMGIHIGMLGRHLNLAREKLEAKTTNQAIYKACKSGLICLLIVSMQSGEMRSYFDSNIDLDFTRARRSRSKTRRREDGAELQHRVLVARNMTI